MPKRQREGLIYEPGEAVPRDVTCIIIPGSVRVVPAEVFYDNHSLREVVLEEGVVEVGYRAFFNCSLLRHVHLPSTLLKIGAGSFWGCTSLREIHLPEGITEIGNCAFEGLPLERVRLLSPSIKLTKSHFPTVLRSGR